MQIRQTIDLPNFDYTLSILNFAIVDTVYSASMLIMLILKRQRRQTSVREKKAEIKRNLFAERKILIVEFNTKINILAMFYSRTEKWN